MRLSPVLLLVPALTAISAPGQIPIPDALARVAEEAEVFQQNAPKSLTQEKLEQRALMPPPRFRPRLGEDSSGPPKPRFQVREIVSEYSVGPLPDSATQNLVEFRVVTSVDGRPVQNVEKARHTLSLGVHSNDDRLRKRMLEDFAHHGLVDLATDYGLILLAFTHRGQQQMKITPVGEGRVGPDDALVFDWQQTNSEAGELEFRGKRVARRPLQGTLYLRKTDGVPLRVETWVEYVDTAKHKIRDEATIDYVPSPHGFLTPASVRHQHSVDAQLVTENLYSYEPFKFFSADADIKFTEVPTQPPAAPAKK